MNRDTKKRIAGIIPLLLSIGAGALSLLSCSEEKKATLPEPTIQAFLADERIQVKLQVPPRHHAYLDAGREGNLIPITFDWQAWSTAPAKAPQPLEAPTGDVDEDSGARILRGEGTFVFQKKATPVPADFRVRVQICDEVKGVCYRPAWYSVKPGA